MTKTHDVLVFVGRFQPFHEGHLRVLQLASSMAENVLVAIGSAFGPRTESNPLTYDERHDIVTKSAKACGLDNITIAPIRDKWSMTDWANDLRAIAGEKFPGRRIGMIGHAKDASSSYISAVPGFDPVTVPRMSDMDATTIRHAAYLDGNHGLAPFRGRMPPSAFAAMEAFCSSGDFDRTKNEWLDVLSSKKKWEDAPYKPTFNTSDCVLVRDDKILFMRRKTAFGNGLLALPGGYLEPDETLLACAIRELEEETGIVGLEPVHAKTFDHPARDPRGRHITVAHLFFASKKTIPKETAEGGGFEWIGIEDIPMRSAELFLDHGKVACDTIAEAIDPPNPIKNKNHFRK